nr:unnamed protein product [Spirometra erinaceieuropaei]
MLTKVYTWERHGIDIEYGTEGKLFETRRSKAPLNVSNGSFPDLVFADECVLDTTTEDDMQRSVGLIAFGCSNSRLTNTGETVDVLQPASNVE